LPEASTGRGRLRRFFDVLGPFLALIAVAGLFEAIAPGGFIGAYRVKVILTQTAVVALGAIGMTFVIRSGGIDLSVGSLVALASVATALAMRAGLGAPVALVVGAGAGLAAGLLNGGLIAGLQLPPFIATLGTLGAARGASKWLADEQKVDAPSGMFAGAMSKTPDPEWLVVAPGVWLCGLCALAAAFALRRTVFGTWVTAIGSNERTALLAGVPVRRTKLVIYGVSGLAAGLAGVLQFGRLTVGDPTTGIGLELDVIAAVVIGGASLSGGTGTILGSLVGALLMGTLASGCDQMGVPNYAQEILIGAIIVGAVALDRYRHGVVR